IAKEIVNRDIYVDDVVSSIMNFNESLKAVSELTALFKAGGFELAKWASNSKEVLNTIPENNRLSQTFEFNNDETLKVL
ncbi:hypothetical protein Q8G50_34405, partial [Klebsiella pneumoniae]